MIILLALAAVTGPVASNMSDQVDMVALASMAASDPASICMEARKTLTGLSISNANFTMRPGFQRSQNPPNGTSQHTQQSSDNLPHGVPYQMPLAGERSYTSSTASMAFIQAGIYPSLNMMWRWPFLSLASNDTDSPGGNFTGKLLMQWFEEGLSAMRGCNVITGAYCDLDVPSYIARACEQCDESVKNPPLGVTWADGHAGIMSARRNVSSMAACLFDDSFVARDMASTLANAAQRFERTLFTTHYTVAGKLKANPQRVMGGVVMGSGLIRVDAYSAAVLFAGEPHPPRMLWLELAEQNMTTAKCMAQRAPALVRFLSQGVYKFQKGDTNEPGVQRVVPAALGMHINQLWLLLDAPEYTRDRINLYTCTDSIFASKLGALGALELLKHASYKEWAKKRYKVSLFGSMHDLNYDDVYAVYTAILGALFGSFALLVATLFAFALAAVRHVVASLVCAP